MAHTRTTTADNQFVADIISNLNTLLDTKIQLSENPGAPGSISQPHFRLYQNLYNDQGNKSLDFINEYILTPLFNELGYKNLISDKSFTKQPIIFICLRKNHVIKLLAKESEVTILGFFEKLKEDVLWFAKNPLTPTNSIIKSEAKLSTAKTVNNNMPASFPDTSLLSIYSFLSFFDLLKARKVSRNFKRITDLKLKDGVFIYFPIYSPSSILQRKNIIDFSMLTKTVNYYIQKKLFSTDENQAAKLTYSICSEQSHLENNVSFTNNSQTYGIAKLYVNPSILMLKPFRADDTYKYANDLRAFVKLAQPAIVSIINIAEYTFNNIKYINKEFHGKPVFAPKFYLNILRSSESTSVWLSFFNRDARNATNNASTTPQDSTAKTVNSPLTRLCLFRHEIEQDDSGQNAEKVMLRRIVF